MRSGQDIVVRSLSLWSRTYFPENVSPRTDTKGRKEDSGKEDEGPGVVTSIKVDEYFTTRVSGPTVVKE